MLRLPTHINPLHCIVTKQYAVYTPPMHEMINLIGDWIDQQLPGGFIFGASRLGKTRCVQWHLIDVLEDRFKAAIPLVVWSRRPDSHLSEAVFWHQILLASQFEFSEPGRPIKRSQGAFLCKQRFISIANNAQRNYVVLLIDEAQDLTLREWKWLVGLQNDLDFSGYLLSVISVGTHQLGHQYEYMASTGNAHIAARFLATHKQFHGLRSAEEVKYVLNGYDIDSEWPSGSNKSFLAYFSPKDFAAGRRLSCSASDLWMALNELTPATAKKYIEFPMQHIARTIELALFRLAQGEEWGAVTSYTSWLEGLAKTNFSDHMRIISTAG
ncbi:ATP-binding protein [uncultured Deefgea sp.]|uniref:ATP-binding protein n=1 Tax=uncultured Deefgea sp. TaxID=1304914 RepID=UPI0025987653|nr:ATP-binding protein [uncultured Deefgea sp.]